MADTEGFEDKVLQGAMDVLAAGGVDNMLLECKEYNSIQKRQLLRDVFRTGGFKYIYGYREQYGTRLENVPPTLDGLMTDLTSVIIGDPVQKLMTDTIVPHNCEDHFFTKHPLPASMLAGAGSAQRCM